MQDLLRALDRDPTRRRWQVGFVLGAAALAGGLYTGRYALEARRADACEREGESIAEVWNAERSAALRQAMEVEAVSYGPVAFERVAHWIDEKASGWSAATVQRCLAAGDAAPGEDAQRVCLDARREELVQLLAVLESQGPPALASAIQAAAALTPSSRCLDPQWLSRHHALPEDPQGRDAVASVQRTLAESRALARLGRNEDAIARAQAGLRAAEDAQWPPLVGAAQLALGQALLRDSKLDEAMVHLRSAFLAATETGDEVTAVVAGGMLAYVAGFGQHDAPAGELWREISGATMRQAGLEDDLVGASWRQSVAATFYAEGDFKGALEHYLAAAATRARLLGADHPETLGSNSNIASALVQLGDFQGARDILEPTIEDLSRIFGPHHPDLSDPLGTLARVCDRLGDDAAAREHTERALQIARAAHGPEHLETARAMVNHANTLDDEQEELRLNEAALPILQASLGSQHPAVAGVMSNVARAHQKAGNLEQATRLLQQSLDAHSETPGREHPATALIMMNLAEVHAEAARWEDARSLFEEAAAVRRESLGEAHPDTAWSLFRLAQVRWEHAASPAEATSAVALARKARAGLSGPDSEELVPAMDRWLEERDPASPGDRPPQPRAEHQDP